MENAIFLYVYGEDYAGTIFKDNCDPQEIYEDMVEEGTDYMEIDIDGNDIAIEIHRFVAVDDSFVDFVLKNLIDYDTSKSIDIIRVNEVK